ncbi:MAG: tRNA 2-thiouridine(34) synthase MnmA [Pseudomonadota bacterium]|nr:tRNA 2-thiouridine(34) synthase MnmA [Pseudomonadota bacterium]
MSTKDRIIVGMSGGVDSSVTAALIKEQGHHVAGLFMKNWEENDNGRCNSKNDYEDAKRVCKKLNIKLFNINFSDIYWDLVFKKFLSRLKSGMTPNPDILCNKEIKFNYFLKYGLSLGFDKVATGHYAKLKHEKTSISLNIPKDRKKDQTYFLYILNQRIMKKILFPLADITKDDVKDFAKSLDIKVFNKKESMGICFIGKRNFSRFIKNYIYNSPGYVKNLSGTVLGRHNGLFNYTIGQRKGIKIGGRKDALSKPWFVVKKDIDNNVLLVTQNEKELLYKGDINLKSVNWITTSKNKLRCCVRFRHGGKLVPAQINKKNGTYTVSLEKSERAITPGQSAVFYNNDKCLGGGIVSKLIV